MVCENEFALGHVPNSLEVFKVSGLLGEATENFLYRFEFRSVRWIMKELKLDGMEFSSLGNDAIDVARSFDQVYQIAKRHFGDRLVDTFYIVARNRWGQPTMVTVQPEVDGENVHLLNLRCNFEQRDEYLGIQTSFKEIWKSMKEDPEWRKLPEIVQKRFAVDDCKLSNIVRTKSGRYVLVDF